MKNAIIVSGLTIALFASSLLWSLPSSEAVNSEMQTPEFWLDMLPDPDKILLNVAEISQFNAKIMEADTGNLHDLKLFPHQIEAEQIKEKIAGYSFPTSANYVNGQPMVAGYSSLLQKQLNFNNIEPLVNVEYGYTIQRANLRSLPTSDVLTSQMDNINIDLLQETALKPAEPVIVMHYNLDKNWALVQSVNYCGWVKTEKLAVTSDRQLWAAYLKPERFLIVTDSRIDNVYSPQSVKNDEIILTMGTKLPLSLTEKPPKDNRSSMNQYCVSYPIKDDNGQLAFTDIIIPASSSVCLGYLPYTKANIIRQAFKLQDSVYGWGGMYNSWDCSSLITDVFQCFGILLPRNTTEQEALAINKTDLRGLSSSERIEIINNLSPGAALYMPGHTMLYIGSYGHTPYVISATGSIRDIIDNNGNWRVKSINKTLVSDLNFLRRSNGLSWLDSITSALQYF